MATTPPGIDPKVYARALADVRALRDHGTYQPKPAKLPPTQREACGTRRGYGQHQRAGETACDPCRYANAAADRRLRTTGSTKETAA